MASEDIAIAEKHLLDYKLAVEYKYLVGYGIDMNIYSIFTILCDVILCYHICYHILLYIYIYIYRLITLQEVSI